MFKWIRRAKAIRLRIYFDKKRLKEHIKFLEFKESVEGLVFCNNLGSYLLIPLVLFVTGLMFCMTVPFIILVCIKFGDREEEKE